MHLRLLAAVVCILAQEDQGIRAQGLHEAPTLPLVSRIHPAIPASLDPDPAVLSIPDDEEEEEDDDVPESDELVRQEEAFRRWLPSSALNFLVVRDPTYVGQPPTPGVTTKRKAVPGAELLTIPVDRALTVLSAHRSALAAPLHAHDTALRAAPTDLLLALHLLHQRWVVRDASPWWPWLRTLPRRPPSPLFLAAQAPTLAWLQGSEILSLRTTLLHEWYRWSAPVSLSSLP